MPARALGESLQLVEPLVEIPSKFTGGEHLVYERSFAAYPASDGWALKVTLRGASLITKTADPAGDAFTVTLPSAETSELLAGRYQYTEMVEKGAERHYVAQGHVVVERDPLRLAAGEGMSFNERMLLLLEARSLGRLEEGEDIEQFGEAGRQVMLIKWSDIAATLEKYRAAVQRERQGGRQGPRVLAIFRGA